MFTSKWHMHRMGLVDFWYYINEEFTFNEGHMLLRGSNGSGKSVTMQSFIPLLLDGNKSSERLDSFGTRSRKIENYLLEEDGRDNRIGYLYLEFKREDSDLYKTIGMGLHARKNKPLDSWYFVIEDNKRINKDLFLMENDLAITKQMLKNKIGTQVIESQKEYMAKVNQALFGFSSTEEYKEMIQLLIQLRSPKLSNSLKPTSINEVLSNSLQPLSEDDLRPMSESITSMDDTKLKLDALKQSFQAAKLIQEAYTNYNKTLLYEKLQRYMDEQDLLKSLQQDLNHKQKSIIETQNSLEKSKQTVVEFTQEKELLEEEKRDLAKSDIKQLIDEIAKLQESQIKQEKNLEAKKNQEELKDNNCLDTKKNMIKFKQELEEYEMSLDDQFKELSSFQEILNFVEHDIIKDEVMNHKHTEFDYSYTKKRIQEEKTNLNKGIECYREVAIHLEKKDKYLDDKEKWQLKLDENEINIATYQKLYLDMVEEYKEKFYKFNREHRLLNLTSSQLSTVVEYLNEYELKDNYYLIDRLLSSLYQESLSTITTKQSSITHDLSINKLNIQELNKEYRYWQDLKDIEPELNDEMKQNREYLNKENIQNIPLYTLLEFSDTLDEKQCGLLEEILEKSGLLNALVVEEKDKEKVLNLRLGMSDTYLFTTLPLEQLTSVYLNEIEALQDVLKQLGIDPDSIQFTSKFVKLGQLTMTLSHTKVNQYIGQLARERLRQDKLDELTHKITGLNTIQEALESNLKQTKEDKELLTKEFKDYPDCHDLESIKKDLYKYEMEMQELYEKLKLVNEEIKQEETLIHHIQHQIVEIANKLQINVNEKIFNERYEAFEDYLTYLMAFENTHTKYISKYEQYTYTHLKYEEAIEELDYIRVERMDIDKELQKIRQMIVSKQELLNQLGGQDIVERMEKVSKRLIQIPQQINELQIQVGTLQETLKNIYSTIEEIKNTVMNQKEKVQLYQDYYEEELKLHYVFKEDEIGDIKNIKNALMQKKNDLQRIELQNSMQEVFQRQRIFLQEYNLITTTLFSNRNDPFATRVAIMGRYRGNKIHFHQLLIGLEEDIIRQGELLKENERELIEDILVNDMSRKIRRLIAGSEQWVNDMNRFMNEMNTSSGLKLNLEWKSKKAENEEELSSQKLVKLLKTDVHLLKPSDLNQLSTHFQSKISSARKLSEKEEVGESFHQIMKRVMDYRNWFDFTIMYEKSGDKKKELTNNAFYQFSGGEKAMSMYVPLFSAVAAKYMIANEDAPMLIALDEAFAGVDEKNIDTMFELISKFKFDYMMNSQVLWGDYPSVKALAIHELFRPENAKFVTVISYTWNGHIKQLVGI